MSRVRDGAACTSSTVSRYKLGVSAVSAGRVHVHGEERVAGRAAMGRNSQDTPLHFFAIGPGQDSPQIVA